MGCHSEGSFTVENHAISWNSKKLTSGHRVCLHFDCIADGPTLRVMVLSLGLEMEFSTGVDGTCTHCMPPL